jgi:hypothetical protein
MRVLSFIIFFSIIFEGWTRPRPHVADRRRMMTPYPHLRVSRSSPSRILLSAKQHAAQIRRAAKRKVTLTRLRTEYRINEMQRYSEKARKTIVWRFEEDLPRRMEKVRYRLRFRIQAFLDQITAFRTYFTLAAPLDWRAQSSLPYYAGVTRTLMKKLQKSTESVNLSPNSRKRGVLSVSDMANQAVRDVLAVSHADGWVEVAQGSGVTVWRKYLTMQDLGKSTHKGQRSSLVPVVKASAVVNASAESVYKLLKDNKRVHEYNDNCRVVMDMQKLDKDTKITWAASPRFGPFKPRDFCTLVHFRKTTDGLLIVANIPAEHKNAPPSSSFVRSEILLGGNIIKPLGPRKTELTILTSIDTGDLPSAGAALVNKMAATTPISFIRRLEVAAQCSDDDGSSTSSGFGIWRSAFRSSRLSNRSTVSSA